MLRLTLPLDFAGSYVAEMAYMMDGKYANERDVSALQLGYDCQPAEVKVLAICVPPQLLAL